MKDTIRAANEIKKMIAANNLKGAIRKFSFFVENNTKEKDYQYSAIILSNEFTEVNKELNLIGRSQEAENRRNQVLKKVLFIIDEIVDAKKNEYGKYLRYYGEAIQDQPETISSFNEINNDLIFCGEDLSKSYEGFELEKISLELRSGEITAVVGKNASGKSTLLKIISGIIKPDDGIVNYPGFQCEGNWYCIKKNIGYVPQELSSKKLLLIEDLILCASMHDIFNKENHLMVSDVVFKLDLKDFLGKHWNELSGGYKIRFELANMLVWRPKLLVLDEPLANLDIHAKKFILSTLKEYSKSLKYPLSIIMTSQNIEEIENIADKLIFLDNGSIVFNDLIENIENKFPFALIEIKTNLTLEVFRRVLNSVDNDYSIIADDFEIYTVKLSNKNYISLILKKIIQEKGQVIYFRDISRSSKRFFV